MPETLRLSRRFTLEEPSDAPDGGGGASRTWTELGAHWGQLTPVSARELIAGSRESSRVTHRIAVRAAPSNAPSRPRASQRFRLGERVFNIRAVYESYGGFRYLTCLVEEGAPT